MLSARLRRYLFWSTIAVGFVGIYAVARFCGVPRLLRSNLQSFTQTHYHRTLSLGEIRFDPFKLKLEVHDLSLPDRDSQPMLSFAALRVELRMVSLWRRAARFHKIELERPFIRALIRSDGTINLMDLATPFATDAHAQAAKKETEPMRLYIDDLAVAAGQATFEHRTHPTPFQARLQPITFELRDFSTTGNTGNAYSLTGTSTGWRAL